MKYFYLIGIGMFLTASLVYGELGGCQPEAVPLLVGKTSKEKANIKAESIVNSSCFDIGERTLGSKKIEIRSIEKINGGIEVIARAFEGTEQLGFGDKGQIEWERFRIFNPPIKVPDGTKRTLTNKWGDTWQENNLKEDPKEAVLQTLAHIVSVTGKTGTKIELGSVGHTTDTFYPDANPESTSVDGYPANESLISWADVRDALASGSADDSGTSLLATSREQAGVTTWIMNRIITLFDTSSIPDGATISGATASLYINSTVDGDNDGDDYISVVTSSPALNTAVVVADYDQLGTTEQHDSGQRKDITSISTGVYTDWNLNSIGIGNISKTGITKFGYREGHDIINSAIATDANNTIVASSADTGGSSQDPTLIVTYTSSGGSAPQDIIFFD